MKSIRNRAHYLIIAMLFCLLLAFSVAGFISIHEKHFAYAQEDQEILTDDFDFSDNSILVTMDKDIGGVNKVHDIR